MTPNLTDEDRGKLQDARVVASVSGGKDSAALSLWLTEQGVDHDRIFADTGWEHPDTYEYLRGDLREKLGPIVEVQSEKGGLKEWVRHKGMFPTRMRRFCTEKLKVGPIKKHLDSYDVEIVNAVGVRGQESKARAKMARWEEWRKMDCEVWRPLIDWKEEDVIAIHQRHGLAPNPLYLRGAGVERVGCWPCIFSRKKEIKQVAELTPERIEEIRHLELEVQGLATERYAAKGETFESQGYHPPTFFHRGAQYGNGGFWAVDEVVAWSQTAHGGRQLPLFDGAPAGCIKWGMCDHAWSEEEGE